MTDYTWTIATCEHDIATGGITVAHWRCSASDGDYTQSAYGTVGFTPDASAEGFKPYTDVTEADVLGWVWAEIDKDAMQAKLAAKIEAAKNPVSATGTPWA
jgi:hypothetical protein